MKRTTRRRLARAALLGATMLATAAEAAVEISPFVEARPVISYASDQSPETRAWTELGAGLESSVDSRRIDFDLRYRYGQRLAVSGPLNDDARHTGAGSMRAELLRDLLYLDALGSATLVNTQFGGLNDQLGDDPSQQQTYAASVQPAIRRRFGRLQFNARYSYGIFEVEGQAPALRIGAPVDSNQLAIGGASDTRNQSASVTLGNAGRSDRLRWRLIGEYQRDRIEQLDQRYTSKRAVADGEYALSRKIGLIGSVGYEDILDRQDSILVDPTTGLAIPDANGFAQRDPANPFVVNFDEEGITYEAGFRWSPSRRTNVIARAGRRFGDFTASGSAELRFLSDLRLLASYTESINNFGRLFTTLFTDPVSGVVTPISSFAAGGSDRTPLGATTCAFGLDPATGTCRFSLTQVASNATFKDQSAAITLAKGGGGELGSGGGDLTPSRLTGAISGFYTRRSYLGEQVPGVPSAASPFSLAGSTDISYGVDVRGERELGERSAAAFDLRAQRNRYGLSRDAKDLLLTAQLSYTKPVGRQISLSASLFASRRWVDDSATTPATARFDLREGTTATFAVGLRYSFTPVRGRRSQSAPDIGQPEG